MPRPRSLEESDLAAAGLAVIDRDGTAALSMRTVAAELGMGTMSLYRYVKSREEIERLVVDRVLESVDITVPARASWTKQITLLAERIRRAVGAHPAVVPLLMLHRHDSRGVIRSAEAFLRALEAAGFSGRRRVIALRTLNSYLIGALQAQHLAPLPGTATELMARLPASLSPLLAETARTARTVHPEDEFRGGLEVILNGLKDALRRT